jgi:hypothetical protein
MEIQELREIFADELDMVGKNRLATMVRSGTDNSNGGTAAIAAMQRALRHDEIGKFKPIISIGFDKNGEADFRARMAVASLDQTQMDALCRMMPWGIKTALELWLNYGPSSKEMEQQAATEQETIEHIQTVRPV